MKFRIALSLTFAAATLHAQWAATWTTAQPMIRPMFRPPAAAGAAPGGVTAGQTSGQPAGQPAAAAPAGPPPGRGPQMSPAMRAIATTGFKDQTVRMMVHTSLGGSRARVKLENTFGVPAVTVKSAHIALKGAGPSSILPETDKALTFSGRSSVTIGPGVILLSDPVDLNIPKLGDVAVTLYFSEETGPPASHNGLRTSYIATGDATAKAELPADAFSAPNYYFLAGIDVAAPANTPVIVTLGDSITEGARSTPDTNHQWPTLLAARMLANKATANFAVANMGIGGNRLLRDGTGASALARLDRDVFSQSGVKWMTIMEGINDIGRGVTVASEIVTADDLIAGYKQIVERAHAMGIKVMGCTLTPYGGAGYYSEAGEVARAGLNNWIRTSGVFDAVADFDAATRDPKDPKKIRAEFDPGDHLHPNDAGYQAMADSIDLAVFTKRK